MLVRLAERRATGALLRDTGVLYLADGAVVHAESPAAPGIDVLLTAGGRLRPELWREAVDEAGAACRIAGYLLDHRRMSGGELEIRHLSALYDAAYFALAPDGGPSRFRHGAVHWFGRVRPVGVADVVRETRRRRRYLDDLWPHSHLDAAPPVRVRAAPLPPVTRRQQDVLDLADGRRTPGQIATRLGRPAFHTLVDIRRLAAAGHLETGVRTSDRSTATAPGTRTATAASAGSGPAATTSATARTAPGASLAPVLPPDLTGGAPDVAVLLRVRDALEARL
ncbi:transcriptional regulator [Streptomyces sp. PLK6-54]|uniref:Transcriptional regulator n=2 Tax=Actinacidiphila acidipaludis TaxID=2873382 RepID=A0ABS7QG48_9ACTN|nr:transcriptional regulator [Streptomyces acidipaludis]